MARRLNTKDKSFAEDFVALLYSRNEAEEDVAGQVKGIIADIRKRGDTALVELTNKFDRANVTLASLKLSDAEIEAGLGQVTKPQLDAIAVAAARIETYHQRQLPKDDSFTDDIGAVLGWRWTSVDSVGLYVPGGTAAYPSSAFMNKLSLNLCVMF